MSGNDDGDPSPPNRRPGARGFGAADGGPDDGFGDRAVDVFGVPEDRPDDAEPTADVAAGYGFAEGVTDESAAAARSFVEAVPAPALACDPDSLAIHAANDAAAALFGQDRSTLTLMGLDDLGGPTTAAGESVADLLAAADADGVAFELDVTPGGAGRRRLALRLRTATIGDREWLLAVATDVTARARAERGRRSQVRALGAVAATVPTALFRCDARGTLARWNERLSTDTGYADPALDGRALPGLFDGEGRSAVADALARTYAEATVTDVEAPILTRSGERVPYRLTLGPVTDGGEVVGVVGVGEDLTEASLRRERLAVLTRVLRHNFRNEINVVMGFAEQLRADSTDPETAARLDRIVDTAGRLLRLGETSRKVERLFADESPPEPTALSDAVAAALASLPDRLRDQADVAVDVPEGISASVVDRFSDAVAELVDNAIRHNDAERPTVRITADELPSESWVSLVVADDGPGMPSAERAVLLGEETPLRHASGLGLWYVNWVVTAGGGSFDIDDSADGGSRIELLLRADRGQD